MKTLLTVVICGNTDAKSAPLYDGIELLYPNEDENEKEFLTRAAKSAKGKYAVVCDNSFRFSDMQPLLNILDKNTSDMVCFADGIASKTSVLKGCVKDSFEAFSCKLLTVLNCKSLLKTDYTPFTFDKFSGTFTVDSVSGLLRCAETFGKVKAKLDKEIYSYASAMLCERLALYYMYAMLEIRDGTIPAESLISFDGKLKAEIVLFLALEKKFTAAKLQKLRGKGFKISRFTARKFRKILGKLK